jgi:hypothetical protein
MVLSRCLVARLVRFHGYLNLISCHLQVMVELLCLMHLHYFGCFSFACFPGSSG